METKAPSVSSRIGVYLERPLPRRLIPVMIALTILCMLATHGIIRYGSISAALSRAAGHRILVDPPFHSFGDVVQGSTIKADLNVRNESSERITIQGAQGSCSCAVVGDLPCVIEPRASRVIVWKVTAPREAVLFSGTISLYTDDRDTPVIALEYEGRAVEPTVAGPGGVVPH